MEQALQEIERERRMEYFPATNISSVVFE